MSFSLFRKPVEEFLKAVDEVTLKDISSISQKLISSPLTMASYGDGTFHCFFFSFINSSWLFMYVIVFWKTVLDFLVSSWIFMQFSTFQVMNQWAASSLANEIISIHVIYLVFSCHARSLVLLEGVKFS